MRKCEWKKNFFPSDYYVYIREGVVSTFRQVCQWEILHTRLECVFPDYFFQFKTINWVISINNIQFYGLPNLPAFPNFFFRYKLFRVQTNKTKKESTTYVVPIISYDRECIQNSWLMQFVLIFRLSFVPNFPEFYFSWKFFQDRDVQNKKKLRKFTHMVASSYKNPMERITLSFFLIFQFIRQLFRFFFHKNFVRTMRNIWKKISAKSVQPFSFDPLTNEQYLIFSIIDFLP